MTSRQRRQACRIERKRYRAEYKANRAAVAARK